MGALAIDPLIYQKSSQSFDKTTQRSRHKERGNAPLVTQKAVLFFILPKIFSLKECGTNKEPGVNQIGERQGLRYTLTRNRLQNFDRKYQNGSEEANEEKRGRAMGGYPKIHRGKTQVIFNAQSFRTINYVKYVTQKTKLIFINGIQSVLRTTQFSKIQNITISTRLEGPKHSHNSINIQRAF